MRERSAIRKAVTDQKTTRRGEAKASRRPRQTPRLPRDPHESAALAHCRYVDDSGKGITRVRSGKGFRYVGVDAKPLRDAETLGRIRALVIPPAWTKVWICPLADGHIQVTGRDARGRKQYRYHPRFRQIRDETKYDRMLAFAYALPGIRLRVDEHLSSPALSREKVLATVVRLLETTLIRVGNEEYARENGSFGLTTMQSRHVVLTGSTIRFHFKGKSGKEHEVLVHDRRVARIVGRCNDLPGEELFQYVDETGARHSVEASDVNEFLRTVSDSEFSAKDFRTWAGTVLAAQELKPLSTFDSQAAAKRNIADAIRRVSSRLGNTPSVCRRCYVHPHIFDAYLSGRLPEMLSDGATRVSKPDLQLSPEETAVLGLLADPSNGGAGLARAA